MKNISLLTSEIALTVVLSTTLTGCFSTIPYGMQVVNGGRPGFGENAIGISTNSEIGSGRAGDANWTSPINNPNAKTFADNVIKLDLDRSTKNDALALLGNPGFKNPVHGGECWQYPLNTGSMPAVGWLYFKNSTLVGVEVVKTSFQGPIGGGTIAAETIYSRGTKLRP